MHHRFGGGVRPVVLACAALACTMVSTALAQSVPPGTNLPAVTVTGNPLGATDSVATVAALTGANLALRGNSTLGETLDGTPGVASSYFGPNASRPIIRGLDGDRVRVLQNSGVSADASGGSADHAVPADPIAAERIEVLRGPATLLYGGSAVGGVVNVIDNRIPQERQFDAAGGVGGRVQLEAASGNAERTAAALLETGTDRYTLHVDGFHRQSGDVGVPVELPCSASGAVTSARAICNSAAQSRGVAVGGAVFGESTRLGASVSSYHSDYGTVAEDSVTIGMRSERAALEWDWQGGSSWVRSLQLRASQSDYAHTEFDTGVPGTTFRTQARDARLQLRHAPWGGWEGALGVGAGGLRWPPQLGALCPGQPPLCAAERSVGCAVERGAPVAAQRQPGLQRTCTQGLRAVCQRSARCHPCLRGRRPRPGSGKVRQPGRGRTLEGRGAYLQPDRVFKPL